MALVPIAPYEGDNSDLPDNNNFGKIELPDAVRKEAAMGSIALAPTKSTDNLFLPGVAIAESEANGGLPITTGLDPTKPDKPAAPIRVSDTGVVLPTLVVRPIESNVAAPPPKNEVLQKDASVVSPVGVTTAGPLQVTTGLDPTKPDKLAAPIRVADAGVVSLPASARPTDVVVPPKSEVLQKDASVVSPVGVTTAGPLQVTTGLDPTKPDKLAAPIRVADAGVVLLPPSARPTDIVVPPKSEVLQKDASVVSPVGVTAGGPLQVTTGLDPTKPDKPAAPIRVSDTGVVLPTLVVRPIESNVAAPSLKNEVLQKDASVVSPVGVTTAGPLQVTTGLDPTKPDKPAAPIRVADAGVVSLPPASARPTDVVVPPKSEVLQKDASVVSPVGVTAGGPLQVTTGLDPTKPDKLAAPIRVADAGVVSLPPASARPTDVVVPPKNEVLQKDASVVSPVGVTAGGPLQVTTGLDPTKPDKLAAPIRVADAGVVSLPPASARPTDVVVPPKNEVLQKDASVVSPVGVTTGGPLQVTTGLDPTKPDKPAAPIRVADAGVVLPPASARPIDVVVPPKSEVLQKDASVVSPVGVTAGGPLQVTTGLDPTKPDKLAAPIRVADAGVVSLPPASARPTDVVVPPKNEVLQKDASVVSPVGVTTGGPLQVTTGLDPTKPDKPAAPIRVADAGVVLPPASARPTDVVVPPKNEVLQKDAAVVSPVGVTAGGPLQVTTGLDPTKPDKLAAPIRVADAGVVSLPPASARPTDVVVPPKNEVLQKDASVVSPVGVIAGGPLQVTTGLDPTKPDKPAAPIRVADAGVVSLPPASARPTDVVVPPKNEVLSQGTSTPPAFRGSSNPQFAIAREATQDLAAATQSYNRSVPPESKTTNTPPVPGSDSQGVNQFHPGTIPSAPAPKDGGKTVLPPDPPTLLAALEAAATRKASIPGTTSAFIDGTVSTGKLGLSPLQGAQIAEAVGAKQDAVGSATVKTDVRGAVVPGAGIPGVSGISGGVPVSLDGRLVQNPNQIGVTDTASGAVDPRKGLGNAIPGALGPGISAEQPEGHGNKRILDVPNLNLDDKTGQLTDRKGKGDPETNQSDTGKTSRGEQAAIAAAELANLLNQAKKGQKENPEQDGNIDATGAAQVLAGSTRLKHKVRLGETLSEISITYFNDDIAATLIMQINYSVLEPQVHNYGVVVLLPADLIIDIPSDAEVAEFKKQLIAGTQTLVNIVCDG